MNKKSEPIQPVPREPRNVKNLTDQDILSIWVKAIRLWRDLGCPAISPEAQAEAAANPVVIHMKERLLKMARKAELVTPCKN